MSVDPRTSEQLAETVRLCLDMDKQPLDVESARYGRGAVDGLLARLQAAERERDEARAQAAIDRRQCERVTPQTRKPRREVREVRGVCKACDRWWHPVDALKPTVVSPSGLAHHGTEWGTTWCGKDAAGPEWWWAL